MTLKDLLDLCEKVDESPIPFPLKRSIKFYHAFQRGCGWVANEVCQEQGIDSEKLKEIIEAKRGEEISFGSNAQKKFSIVKKYAENVLSHIS